MASVRTILANRGLTWQCDTLTIDSATALEFAWADLARNANEKNIFTFPWFVIPSLTLLARFDPRIVTIYQDGLLIGLLLVRGDIGYAKLPVPFYRTALHYEQYLGTPLVRAGFEAQFAEGLCAWLDTAPARYCFLALTLMTGEGAVADAIGAQCAAQKRHRMTLNQFRRAAIAPLPQNQETTDFDLGAGRRKSLRRSMRSLSALATVAVERLSDQADLVDWIEDFLRLENTGWKREAGSSILSCPNEAALYRQIISCAFHNGSLNFSRLCLGGQPIAYTLDIVIGRHAYCLKSAIDQTYKKFAPGVLMEFETLKYYRQQQGIELVDSCTAPDNALLNELWPDRKLIVDIIVARKGVGYGGLFTVIQRIKSRTSKSGDSHAR